MRRLATLVLPALLAGAFTLAGCGGDEDLTVAVADDVRGARLDSAAHAAPPAADSAAESATEVVELAQGPDVAQPASTEPAAVPDPTEVDVDVDVRDDGDQEQVPELPLGDVPTTDDEITPPAAEEPGVGDAGLTPEEKDELDIPVPDPDDWKPEPPKPPVLIDGEWHTSFDYLGSFDAGLDALSADSPLAQHTQQTELPEKDGPVAELPKGIPDEVRALDGQKVRIEGYMIPLKFEDGAVKTFFLSRYMMGCCFGVLPKANEVIEVEMVNEKGAYYDAYMPFVVVGTFEIVEEGTSPEFLQSVFRMKADSCDYAEDW